MAKKKTSFELDTLAIIKRRAAEDGSTMSAWVDQLVRREDLRRRIAADRQLLEEADLHGGGRVDAIARAALASHRTQQ